MPKRIAPLSPHEVESASPKDKEYKLSDGGGLYLLVTPSGGKLWRLDYPFNGKRKTLSLKNYPDRSLEDVRKDRDEARQLLANGVDPSLLKKELSAIERAERLASQIEARHKVSFRVNMDGNIEIWKGRISLCLSVDEAIFVKNHLNRLID